MRATGTPLEEAKKAWGDKFWLRVEEFLHPSRYLYSGDDFFVMAYPHVRDNLLDKSDDNTINDIDTWVIHYFSGDMKRLFEIAPFDLKWIAFQRNGKGRFKFYEAEKLKRRISHGRRITKSTTKTITCTNGNVCGCATRASISEATCESEWRETEYHP